MKKIYLMMFVFSAALTHISCGSGSGLRSANLTPAQQQRILDTLQTSIGSADSSANMDPSSTPTGSLSCDQGVENFSVSATSGSVTDVNCVNFEGGSYNATTDLVVNGNVSYQASSSQVVFTYNNVSARRDTRSCTLSGTMSMSAPQSATSSISLQMSLNSLCGATSIRESGNVTFSTSGGHDYANGIMTFDVGSGAYDCQISNLDLNTVSCAILAQSCRFPATLCGVTVSESSVGIGVTADLSSASALCIHAPQASCAIWNSCYDCQNHRLLRGTLEGGSCGNTLFESACRGQISELVKADERTKRYPFINMCVFNELKRECDSRPADSVDICENTTISTLNGCQVRGFSMDCSNETIWSCSDVNLLLSPDDTQPPEPIRIEGRLE